MHLLLQEFRSWTQDSSALVVLRPRAEQEQIRVHGGHNAHPLDIPSMLHGQDAEMALNVYQYYVDALRKPAPSDSHAVAQDLNGASRPRLYFIRGFGL